MKLLLLLGLVASAVLLISRLAYATDVPQAGRDSPRFFPARPERQSTHAG